MPIQKLRLNALSPSSYNFLSGNSSQNDDSYWEQDVYRLWQVDNYYEINKKGKGMHSFLRSICSIQGSGVLLSLGGGISTA